jgi:HEPN domain-containing protein
VTQADGDYQLARAALRRKRPLFGHACFLAQQCAEKSLKALLVAKGQSFPRTHDLVLLADLNSQTGILLPVASTDLRKLTRHPVETRYPGNDPTPEDAREGLATARTLRRFVRRLLGVR